MQSIYIIILLHGVFGASAFLKFNGQTWALLTLALTVDCSFYLCFIYFFRTLSCIIMLLFLALTCVVMLNIFIAQLTSRYSNENLSVDERFETHRASTIAKFDLGEDLTSFLFFWRLEVSIRLYLMKCYF